MGRKKRNFASSSCFFQLIKMPSFQKQDDLAVRLDSNSGERQSLSKAYIQRQHYHALLPIAMLEI